MEFCSVLGVELKKDTKNWTSFIGRKPNLFVWAGMAELERSPGTKSLHAEEQRDPKGQNLCWSPRMRDTGMVGVKWGIYFFFSPFFFASTNGGLSGCWNFLSPSQKGRHRDFSQPGMQGQMTFRSLLTLSTYCFVLSLHSFLNSCDIFAWMLHKSVLVCTYKYPQ